MELPQDLRGRCEAVGWAPELDQRLVALDLAGQREKERRLARGAQPHPQSGGIGLIPIRGKERGRAPERAGIDPKRHAQMGGKIQKRPRIAPRRHNHRHSPLDSGRRPAQGVVEAGLPCLCAQGGIAQEELQGEEQRRGAPRHQTGGAQPLDVGPDPCLQSADTPLDLIGAAHFSISPRTNPAR